MGGRSIFLSPVCNGTRTIRNECHHCSLWLSEFIDLNLGYVFIYQYAFHFIRRHRNTTSDSSLSHICTFE